MQDSFAVRANVPTFERSHCAFHRERTVASTPCAESSPGLSEMRLSGFFPANSLHAASRAYKFYVAAARGVALSMLFDSTQKFDESGSKNSGCSFGRKFYISVHFFLSTRRLSPLFFATQREKRSAFCAGKVVCTSSQTLKMHG